MRAAAALEDGTEKAAVTPGPLAPGARAARRDAVATEAAGARRRRSSRRRSSESRTASVHVYGAARAASLAGERAAARRYYAQLLKICDEGRHARAALNSPRLVAPRRRAGM